MIKHGAYNYSRNIGTSRLEKYVQFNIDLYKGNPYKVPPLVADELNTFTPAKNPAFDFCEAVHFMAYEGKKPVGRITGIINRNLNEKTGKKRLVSGLWILSMMRE